MSALGYTGVQQDAASGTTLGWQEDPSDDDDIILLGEGGFKLEIRNVDSLNANDFVFAS